MLHNSALIINAHKGEVSAAWQKFILLARPPRSGTGVLVFVALPPFDKEGGDPGFPAL